MNITLVVAMSENRVIGADNALPWHLPEDLKRFKALTIGHPMIMGRLTYESIGRPLPGRTTIVVTRDKKWCAAEGVLIAYDLNQAIQLAHDAALELCVDNIMVVGGANIYAQFMTRADRVFVTEVHTFVEGDAYFPELPKLDWEEQSRDRKRSEVAPYLEFSFVEFQKNQCVKTELLLP